MRRLSALALSLSLLVTAAGCSDDGTATAPPDGTDASPDAGSADGGDDAAPDVPDDAGPGDEDGGPDDASGDAEPGGDDADGDEVTPTEDVEDGGPDDGGPMDAAPDDAAPDAPSDVADAAPELPTPDDATDVPTGDGDGGTGCDGPEDCPVFDTPCLEPVCEEGTCGAQPANPGASCNDGDECTVDDACLDDGTCRGTFEVSQPGCGTGNLCAEATGIGELPYTTAGDTTEASNDLDAASCGVDPEFDGSGSNEDLYRFEPPETGDYRFTLAEMPIDEGFDGLLYLLDACPLGASSCVAWGDVPPIDGSTVGGDSFLAHLEAGATYYLAVDGAPASTNANGAYELTVERAVETSCDDDDDGDGDGAIDCADADCTDASACSGAGYCGEATPIDTLPFTHEGSNEGGGNDTTSATCPRAGTGGGTGAGSEDVAFSYAVEETGSYMVRLTEMPDDDDDALDAALYAYAGCPAEAGSSCLGVHDVFGNGGESLMVDVEAGEELYVIVDGWNPNGNATGTFELHVQEATDSEQGLCDDGLDNDGDGTADCQDEDCASAEVCTAPCDEATTIESLPFSQTGDTTDGTNDVTLNPTAASGEAICPEADDPSMDAETLGASSNDALFAFTPDEAGAHRLALTQAPEHAEHVLAVYAGSCPTTATTECLRADGDPSPPDAGGGGEELRLHLEADTTYYVVVDGFANFEDSSENGPFELLVERLEDTEVQCDNDADDDGDGAIDCDDDDCAGDPACAELLCGDGVDNDDDGATDCDDEDCAGTPSCTELNCDNGVDDDDDGATDCADEDCAGTEACALPDGSGTCADPYVLDELPYASPSGVPTTEGAGDEVSLPSGSCPDADTDELPPDGFGDGEPDVIYRLTPETTASYAFRLAEAEDHADLAMALYEDDCPGTGSGPCIVGDDDATSGGEHFSAALEADRSYYLVVESLDAAAPGPYELHVEQGFGGGSPVAPNELAFTELMGNPDGILSDSEAEYLEIVNTSDRIRSLGGLGLIHRSWQEEEAKPTEPTTTEILDTDVLVEPGGMALLARSGDPDEAGLESDGTYSVPLTNSKAVELQLVRASWSGEGAASEAEVVDGVVVPDATFGDVAGRSWQLDAPLVGDGAASANDETANWCYTPSDAELVYATNNYGTPKASNATCSPE